MAHTPFFTSEGQQVLAQGWKLTTDNVESFITLLQNRFDEISNAVSRVTAKANEEREALHLEELFDDSEQASSCLSIPPDVAMVNMYRCGLLALQLLPPKSNAGLVLISDGMLTLPDSTVLESMLTQSRNHNISCSFLQVGSSSHPHSCFGYLPYTDLMKFITTATFGAYLDSCPEVKESTEFNYSIYHRAFLAWNFQRGLHGFKSDVHWDVVVRNPNFWKVKNPYFYSATDQLNRFATDCEAQKKDQKLTKTRFTKSRVANSFTSVLSCRLREGYTIKSVNIFPTTSQIQVTLILPWKHNVNIEYVLRAPWRGKSDNDSFECYYEVSYEGQYSFLHDVTCLAKNKNIRSDYRWTSILQFWTTLKNLTEADKFLAHLSNFSRKSGMDVPDSVKKSSSLFVLSPDSNDLLLSSENSAFQQFASYWKHICLLDINVWHKWMHTHRINVILKHDVPLPLNLHESNSGTFPHVQCVNAMTALTSLLREFSSFVLLENYAYIKIIHISTGTGSSTTSFLMIRVTTLLPCVILHVAFIGGTPGDLRHKIVDELKEKIHECKFHTTLHDSSTELESTIVPDSEITLHRAPDSTSCFVLTRKPVDKIRIKYDQVPANFSASFESYFSHVQPSSTTASVLEAATDTLATLSRYLHHQRWVWVTREPIDSSGLTPLSTVLTQLMRKRFNEGFHVVYNKDGIVNMMIEVDMIVDGNFPVPCIIQYIMFPAQTTPALGKE